MNQYISLTELKALLGITSSTQDTMLGYLNKQATQIVNGILSVSDLSLHGVSGERHDARGQVFYLKDLHCVSIGQIIDNVDVVPVTYSQTQEYLIENYKLTLFNYVQGGRRQLKIDYAAGWNARQSAYITVVNYSALATKTITVGNLITKTLGIDISIGTSNETCAINIANALNGVTAVTGKTVSAFASGARVYVLDDEVGGSTSIALTSSESTNLTVSHGTLWGIDFPEDIKAAIVMLVGALKARSKNPNVKSYTIGSKSVSFATKEEFDSFRDFLRPYMRAKLLTPQVW